jgi:acetoin utilization deacetylase AcuC-like enzyme
MFAWFSHPSQHLHDPGPGHPECPGRLGAIDAALAGRPDLVAARVSHVAPRATEAQLRRVHVAEHVARVHDASPRDGLVVLDPDTKMSPASLEAGLTAAGACVAAVDAVLTGPVRRAFCAVRPPGHHATPVEAMGFCLFDSVAVAAAHALEVHGLSRVAIVDFDVHHGNGTEDIFRDRADAMVCQTFQSPQYPNLPFAQNDRRLVNVPLRAGTGSDAFRRAVREAWLPALHAYQPELVLVSAGFDAHRDDPIGGLRLDEADYTWVTAQLREVAERHAGGRIVSSLEGGYDLDALGRCVVAHLEGLA